VKITRVAGFFLTLITTILFWSKEVQAICIPPFAKIDSITPHDNCLDINDKTKFCGGSIEIINNCGDVYYVEGEEIKSGRAVYPSLPDPTWTITITNRDGSKNIIVKGTSSEENFSSKPYSQDPNKKNKIVALFDILILLAGSSLFLVALKIINKKPKRISSQRNTELKF